MADALSQEARIYGGVRQGLVIGPLACQRPLEFHHCDNAAFRRRRRQVGLKLD